MQNLKSVAQKVPDLFQLKNAIAIEKFLKKATFFSVLPYFAFSVLLFIDMVV